MRVFQAVLLCVVLGYLGYILWKKAHPPAPIVMVMPTPEPTPKPTPSPTPTPSRTPIPRRLAAEGIYFILKRVSITSASGITAYPPGVQVRRLKDNKTMWQVTDGKTVFDVKPDQLTNDLDIAGAAANRYVEEVNSDASARVATGGVAIIKATYGNGNRTLNVTDRVRAILAAGQRSVQCSTELAGFDPAPGSVKELVVFYSVGANPGVVAKVREGDEFYFPVQPPPPSPAFEPQTAIPVTGSRFPKSGSSLDGGAYNEKRGVTAHARIYIP